MVKMLGRIGANADKEKMKFRRQYIMTLEEFFQAHPKAALGFSGGVDSSYLLYAAKKYGADVKGYFINGQFQPKFELDDAMKLAHDIDVGISVIDADILSIDEVAANPDNRCYYCKKQVFGLLQEAASADGYELIIDGTNASDDVDDRPGMKAIGEIGVLSPLRLCGLTKDDVRRLSKEAGLFTWNKPSYACLATRIPTGERITEDALIRVEGAEDALFGMGFTDFRVRKYGEAARLQLPADQMARAVELRGEIRQAVGEFFDVVMLDLKER